MEKYVRVCNLRNQKLLGDNIRVAESFWQRFKGLMLTPPLKEGEGLLIEKCNSIHMCFMRYAIDAVFIDASSNIVALYENLRPWLGFTKIYSNAKSVLELPSGSIKKLDLSIDDTLKMESLK